MFALAQFNLVTLVVALVIGIITGRWMFARRAAPPPAPEEADRT
jgi:uncharacterized protein YneF (UPF0154 family)